MRTKLLKPMLIQILCAVVVLGTGSPLASAADSPGVAAARVGVQKTIDRVNALLKNNASARVIADAMYEDDLMITGEGEKRLYLDLKSFMGPLAEYSPRGSWLPRDDGDVRLGHVLTCERRPLTDTDLTA
jgi:hypothetical protein